MWIKVDKSLKISINNPKLNKSLGIEDTKLLIGVNPLGYR